MRGGCQGELTMVERPLPECCTTVGEYVEVGGTTLVMLVLSGRLIPWGRPESLPGPSVLHDRELLDLTELEYSFGSPEVVPSFPEQKICIYEGKY
jgi:hypothetical protein